MIDDLKFIIYKLSIINFKLVSHRCEFLDKLEDFLSEKNHQKDIRDNHQIDDPKI